MIHPIYVSQVSWEQCARSQTCNAAVSRRGTVANLKVFYANEARDTHSAVQSDEQNGLCGELTEGMCYTAPMNLFYANLH